MPRFHPHRPRPIPALVFSLIAATSPALADDARPLPTPPADAPASPASWSLVRREVHQDGGHWQVDYRLRLDADGPLDLPAEAITAHVRGWVSNSRIAAHSAPKESAAILSGPSGLSGSVELVTSVDESIRCEERIRLVAWSGDAPPPAEPPPTSRSRRKVDETIPPPAAIRVEPGGTLGLRLRLEHHHFLYGPYDPLLGERELTLTLGATTFRDKVPLDRERRLALPVSRLADPPADRRDSRYFISAPDSLHLESHVPGNHVYRFPEMAVRYGTPMRLRYWYLIAVDSEGECRVKVQQIRDAPNSWKMLSEGNRDEVLPIVGRWVLVEQVFRSEAEATHLHVEFRIAGAENLGEMWIDDVTVEPLAANNRP